MPLDIATRCKWGTKSLRFRRMGWMEFLITLGISLWKDAKSDSIRGAPLPNFPANFKVNDESIS